MHEDENVAWCAAHCDTIPHWEAVVKKLVLNQPSSAAAELVFSLLSSLLSQQESALEDYIEATVTSLLCRLRGSQAAGYTGLQRACVGAWAPTEGIQLQGASYKFFHVRQRFPANCYQW